jgi:hypothetical protein
VPEDWLSPDNIPMRKGNEAIASTGGPIPQLSLAIPIGRTNAQMALRTPMKAL